MKNLIFVFIILPLLSTPDVPNTNLNGITEAISKGDVDGLMNYFDQNVEIAILDEEDVYNKNQAGQVIEDFFTKNKPKGFSQVHQGTSKGQDSKYCIGNLTTDTATYRVYIYMKVEGEQYFIQELRFDGQD